MLTMRRREKDVVSALDEGTAALAVSHFGNMSTLGPAKDALSALRQWLAACIEGQALVRQRTTLLKLALARLDAAVKAAARGEEVDTPEPDFFGDLQLLLGVSERISRDCMPLVAALDFFQMQKILQPAADITKSLLESFCNDGGSHCAEESPLLCGERNLLAFADLVLELQPIAELRKVPLRNVLLLMLPVLQGQSHPEAWSRLMCSDSRLPAPGAVTFSNK